MTRLEDFKDYMICNDTGFQYKGKEYYLFLFGTDFVIGRQDEVNLENEPHAASFDKADSIDENQQDLLEHYIIDGKPLIELIDEIEY